MIEPAYRYRATLDRVIDGDTYILDIDLGFRVHALLSIRLRGASSPELRAEGGAEARDHAVLLLTGVPLTVESYRDQQSFSRWIADVHTPDGSLAELMIEAGHAVA